MLGEGVGAKNMDLVTSVVCFFNVAAAFMHIHTEPSGARVIAQVAWTAFALYKLYRILRRHSDKHSRSNTLLHWFAQDGDFLF